MRFINPVTIVLLAIVVYLGLLAWTYNLGVQGGKDYMVNHYQVLGI
jgi:hypothetical protein